MTGVLGIGAYESLEQSRERGRGERKSVPRSRLAELAPSQRDPVDVLVEQNAPRVPDLVPLRFARMLADPFAFYRGSAALMAEDLAASPHTSLRVVACGDAHVSNFGVYASSERALVFDLNDFDEVAVAPWEWDLKRLVTSVVIGARQAGHGADRTRDLAAATAQQYVDALDRVMEMDAVSRYYLHAQPELVAHSVRGEFADVIEETARRARRRTSERVVRRLTEVDEGGSVRFREDPPVLSHVGDRVWRAVAGSYRAYLTSVPPDIALLLSHFRIVDIVRRVVGVGSVGTRCYLALLEGSAGEVLVLQIKEALASVLVTNGGQSLPEVFSRTVHLNGQGGRVVAGQRMLQAVSDPFLGTAQAGGREFYVRQFHDMKGSVDTDDLDLDAFTGYARSCAALLARSHSQSPDAAAVLAYIGQGRGLVEALADFSLAYADKSLEDYEVVRTAAREGRIEVAPDAAR